MAAMAFYFGRCPCGGDYEIRETEINISARSAKLEGVLQGVCPQCGGRAYKLDTLRRIESVMRDERVDPVANAGTDAHR